MDFKDEKLEAKMKMLGLNWQDFEEQFTKGGGKGGQKVNKSVNCVILTHLPSGLSVRVHKFRELWGNRLSAFRQLVDRLEQQKLGKESQLSKKIEKIRKQKKRRARKHQIDAL